MQNFKELRRAKGLTQSDVAEKLGVSQQAYAKYESGQVVPNADVLAKLTALFGSQDDYSSKGLSKDATVEDFLNASYTAYHAVLNAVSILEAYGFKEVKDTNPHFEVGGKYYVIKNSSAIIAFKIGDLSHYAFNIAGSHTDSPCFRVKGNALLDSPEGKRFNVEKYGGMLMYSFMDIPLILAGRVFESSGNTFTQKVVESKRLFNIPSLCVHHNPTANNDFSPNVQNDMCPLVGEGEDVYSFVSSGKVLDGDLFVVPAVKAYNSGDLLCSPRIDNLTSVYASIKAIADCQPKGVAIAACFDNEEIGSGTKQGAESAFLYDVIDMINRGLGYNDADLLSARRDGFILSIDNGHAVHPAHPEKSDPLNRVYLGGGVVIKHHTNYSTDGFSAAVIKTILDKAGVPHQDYYNHSDIRCGGTIGLMASTNLEMNACDIGLAQLAMHSAVETVDKRDIGRMEDCVKAFFNAAIRSDSGNTTID